jgi:hypothetical protein
LQPIEVPPRVAGPAIVRRPQKRQRDAAPAGRFSFHPALE